MTDRLTPEEAEAEIARVRKLLDASPTTVHERMTIESPGEDYWRSRAAYWKGRAEAVEAERDRLRDLADDTSRRGNRAIDRLHAERDQLHADLTEARLALLAERGDPAGALSACWWWCSDDEGSWLRFTDQDIGPGWMVSVDRPGLAVDGLAWSWLIYRETGPRLADVDTVAKGSAPTAREGMRAAEAALATSSPRP